LDLGATCNSPQQLKAGNVIGDRVELNEEGRQLVVHGAEVKFCQHSWPHCLCDLCRDSRFSEVWACLFANDKPCQLVNRWSAYRIS